MNKNLFTASPSGRIVPATNAVNEAGGVAYARTPEDQLAQYAVTGCFGNTFYVTAEDQLKQVLDVASKCSSEWIAKVALYARERGLMKDMPAVLCAILTTRGPSGMAILRQIFPLCINNGKMIRNFVQVIRSGVVGRKSFGSAVRKLIRNWLGSKTNEALFHASIGDKPSLGDIIKMVHPKPKDEAQAMMFAYLMGKPVAAMGLLPEIVQQFEQAKKGDIKNLPDINFQFLSSLTLSDEQWATICDRASWQTLRMNLNTFGRHNVFADSDRTLRAINRLRNREEIAKAKPMPYQLFTAYKNIDETLPAGFGMALAEATEIALANIPDLPANTVVGVDVSGSMGSFITGNRGTASTKIRCVDVAALFAAAVLRKCPTAKIVPFDTAIHTPRSLGGSVVEVAEKLSGYGGGGTNCSLPLQFAANLPKVDAVVIFSDNESWYTLNKTLRFSGTPSMNYWRAIQKKNPNAKLVCVDLQPGTTTQLVNEPNCANVGGFSDAVFDFLGSFLTAGNQWKNVIEAVDISKAQ